MQYLRARFDDDRAVIVDDEENGRTNVVIELEGGPHRVCLAAPDDYTPDFYDVDLSGTTSINPAVRVFRRKPPR
jgi:hypothetical protein